MGKVLGQTKWGPITEPESPLPVFGKAPQSPTYNIMQGVLGGINNPREVTKPYNEYIEMPNLGEYTYTPMQEQSRAEYAKAYQVPTAPVFGNMSVPTVNKGTLAGYKQEAAAPMLSKVVEGTNAARQDIRSKYADTPYMFNRGIQSLGLGLGKGVGEAMNSASNQAWTRYAPEYAAAVDAEKAKWTADTQSKLAQYQSEMDKAKTLFGMTGGAEDEMAKMMFEAYMKDRLANT